MQVFITTHSTHITSGVPLSAHVVLTSSGGAVSTFVKPTTIPALAPQDVADLERYLDSTRSSLLYARKVLRWRAAEQFVIPGLVKAVMGIDLDEEGIAVVPIFGTHFASYAKLFGPGGIQKKCAILTDGDLMPSTLIPKFLPKRTSQTQDRRARIWRLYADHMSRYSRAKPRSSVS